jgi:hypothetical protein
MELSEADYINSRHVVQFRYSRGMDYVRLREKCSPFNVVWH